MQVSNFFSKLVLSSVKLEVSSHNVSPVSYELNVAVTVIPVAFVSYEANKYTYILY